jgi:deoxyxylulose-5-phosphate synthase
MKIQKLLTLDQEIAEELRKEENASLLVNNLLKEYFEKKVYQFMSTEELKKQVRILDIKAKYEAAAEAEIKLLEVTNGAK